MDSSISDSLKSIPLGAGSKVDADTIRNHRPEDFVSVKNLYFTYNSGTGKWSLIVKYPSGTTATLATEV